MKLYHQVPDCDFYVGDMREVAASLPEKSVHVVACSPPYWNLRDYKIAPSIWGGDPSCNHDYQTEIIPAANGIIHAGGMSGETISGNSATRKPRESNICRKCGACLAVLGLEKLHDCLGWAKGETCSSCFICHMREVARYIWRVLRDDGTFWVNISDSYSGSGPSGSSYQSETTVRRATLKQDGNFRLSQRLGEGDPTYAHKKPHNINPGLKPKDRVGIPERLALALQQDGWTWRDTIHLCKVAPMPESVTDRTTQAHENLFLFTKKARYYFDNDAVRGRPQSTGTSQDVGWEEYQSRKVGSFHDHADDLREGQLQGKRNNFKSMNHPLGRNPRSWMEVRPESTGLAHYATFVGGRLIPRFAIRAGSSEYGVCSKCGNPWRRTMAKSGLIDHRAKGSAYDVGKTAEHSLGRAQAGVRFLNIHKGWESTCSCGDEVIPATIWDPFSGSGTTQIVSRELGRRSIYTDASQPYADIAIKRMQETTLALTMTITKTDLPQQLTFGT